MSKIKQLDTVVNIVKASVSEDELNTKDKPLDQILSNYTLNTMEVNAKDTRGNDRVSSN